MFTSYACTCTHGIRTYMTVYMIWNMYLLRLACSRRTRWDLASYAWQCVTRDLSREAGPETCHPPLGMTRTVNSHCHACTSLTTKAVPCCGHFRSKKCEKCYFRCSWDILTSRFSNANTGRLRPMKNLANIRISVYRSVICCLDVYRIGYTCTRTCFQTK